MPGGDGKDSLLECIVLGAHGFLLLCPSWSVLRTDAT
jgi:hypothetical protein